YDLELIGHASCRAGAFFYGFANHAVRGTPPYQRDGGVFGAEKFRRGDVVDRSLHFAAAFLDHHPALVRVGEFITDQCAVFVVLVGGGSKDVTGNAGNRARGDAALGVFEAQVSLVVVAARRIRGRNCVILTRGAV